MAETVFNLGYFATSYVLSTTPCCTLETIWNNTLPYGNLKKWIFLLKSSVQLLDGTKKSTEKEFINEIITGLFLNRKAGITENKHH